MKGDGGGYGFTTRLPFVDEDWRCGIRAVFLDGVLQDEAEVTRYARRRDANHGSIAAIFAELGCSCANLDRSGVPGMPDLAVGCGGITHLVEVKNPKSRYGKAGLNGNQHEFSQTWLGGPVHVVATETDVLALVLKWRGIR